jgi:hypothetical protein
MVQLELAVVPPQGELESRERVYRHGVRCDAAHVAEGDGGVAAFEQRADTLTESTQVGALDRTTDREGDRFRRTGRHQKVDRSGGRMSSVALPMSSGALAGPRTRNR